MHWISKLRSRMRATIALVRSSSKPSSGCACRSRRSAVRNSQVGAYVVRNLHERSSRLGSGTPRWPSVAGSARALYIAMANARANPEVNGPMQPHEFWQEIEPAAAIDPERGGVLFHAALFDDGRVLRLPIRPLADGKHALASLILNQASFAVVEAIAADLALQAGALRDRGRRRPADAGPHARERARGSARPCPLRPARDLAQILVSRGTLRSALVDHHAGTSQAALCRSPHAAAARGPARRA